MDLPSKIYSGLRLWCKGGCTVGCSAAVDGCSGVEGVEKRC